MLLRPDPVTPRGAAMLEQRFTSVKAVGEHCSWQERPGPAPVVVSAPHAIPHVRAGRRKARDSFTGPLALAVGRITGASVLVADKRVGADPNAGETPFGLRLLELAAGGKVVVDLHGAARRPGIDVAVGVGGGTTLCGRSDLLDAFVAALEDEGLAVQVDVPGLAAHGPERLAQVAAASGTPALQVEVSEELRAPLVRPEQWDQAIEALSRAVLALASLR